MESLAATRPQDRLAKPLQAEDEQEAADDDAKRPDRHRGEGRPEHGEEDRENDQPGSDTRQGRAPAAGHPHRQHDRHSLDRLDGTGQEDGDDEAEAGAAHPRTSAKAAPASRTA